MDAEKEFLELIRLNEAIVYKVCNLYQKDPSLREDLFQEIILNAWKGYPSFRRESRFSTWLYRVALNTAISFYRKSQKIVATSSYLDRDLDFPENGNEEEEALKSMYAAIGSLSKVDKAVVMLYLEDYSYAEMGEILGISVNNVAVKMNRIKARLRGLVAQQN
ncbi:sigma-70 family RNA polymerase sigma factor [Flavihumibacter rivuli]|uniref:RNA polymerase sigma factor n=1 Tax=Flavihumibacter rivuli TaxID=2838156 RepID=UPI001BDF48DE|nr:sigma-70 family RNA polymerase sigma factor [Flavihumibacter rivuli]ULQ57529.1 sigma-70 family RNA polymerase sigma factor [Flavihumibacter rivuli]